MKETPNTSNVQQLIRAKLWLTIALVGHHPYFSRLGLEAECLMVQDISKLNTS